jgi:DNA-binding IclR family transcriptional regulator
MANSSSVETEPRRDKIQLSPLPQSRYTIQVLAKALDLLNVLASEHSGLTLSELCARLNLPKSSVFRYLVTLEQYGFVERVSETDRYELGLKLFELGNLVASQFDYNQAALPFMRSLLERFGETVNLAILHDFEVVYLQVLEGTRSMRMAARPGLRNLPHATALGKAIMAYLSERDVLAIVDHNGLPAQTAYTITTLQGLRGELEQIRKRGYAIDDIENEDGVRCVAAPIFDHSGQAIAAVSLSGPVDRVSPSQVELMGQELAAGAREVSRRLGYSGQPEMSGRDSAGGDR